MKIPPPPKTTTVQVLECPTCGDLIFSRARHDCRHCTCGGSFIDGGFDYVRVGFRPERPAPVAWLMEVKATKTELYDDWNNQTDQYGRIPRDEKEGVVLVPIPRSEE